MKINIFFFSKWKWKADALIQTLYKRAPPGQDKRKEIPLLGALCPPTLAHQRPFPFLLPPTLRCHYFLLPPLVRPRRATLRLPAESGEKKQKRYTVAGAPRDERKVHSGIILYFGPSTPAAACTVHTPATHNPRAAAAIRRRPSTRPPASRSNQPFIGRLGNIYRH